VPAPASGVLESSVTRADLDAIWAELGLVTRTPELVQTLQLAETYAPGRIPVLILGETGTGKDLLAQGLGRLSGRKGAFVPVNCASAQRDLFLAELFGARRGAYTGSIERRRGLVEEAEGGTIFFDEIADLAPEAQGYLLRFLDSGEVRPLGETRSRRIETRAIAATCRDLRALVRQGRFRPDLHARLAGLVLRLPPLRERPEDFDLLVEMLWQREGGSAVECRAVFTPGLQAKLQQFAWPGNVRELRHAVSRALLYSRTHGAQATRANPQQWLRGIGGPASPVEEALEVPGRARVAHGTGGDWSRESLEAALASSGGRIAAAARLLGMSRSHAYRLYKQLRVAQDGPEDLCEEERAG
jgi:DNA-binding NtrC family response regulator